MAEPAQRPSPPDPGGRLPGDGRVGAGGGVPGALATLAALIVGTALLGAVAGFLWATLAPRALIVVVGHEPYPVNPETSAYIAADGWFVLLTAAGGIGSGLLGYTLAVRRRGALAMGGILAGGLAAALTARWIGQHPGSAAYQHGLQVSKSGVLLHASLTLGGWGSLAFWPLTAGLAAGGMEAAALIIQRRQRARAGAGVAGAEWRGHASRPGHRSAHREG
jgi:hypothetical protein